MSKKINIIIDLNINETYNESKLIKGINLKNVNDKIDCIDDLSGKKINCKEVTYLQASGKNAINTEIDIRGLNGLNEVKSNKTCFVSYSNSNVISVKRENDV